MEYLERRPGVGKAWAVDVTRLPTMRQLQGRDPVQVEAFLQRQIQAFRDDLNGRSYDGPEQSLLLARSERTVARLLDYKSWLRKQE